MGKMIEHPRGNVISCRISDAAYAELIRLYPGKTRADILSEALADKVIRARQTELDRPLRSHGC